MKLDLTDKKTAYAAALLRAMLTETHGLPELLDIDDERLIRFRQLFRAVDTRSALNVIITVARDIDKSERARKAMRSRDPEQFRRMGKKSGEARRKAKKLSTDPNLPRFN